MAGTSAPARDRGWRAGRRWPPTRPAVDPPGTRRPSWPCCRDARSAEPRVGKEGGDIGRYGLRISDGSSDVCASDLQLAHVADVGEVRQQLAARHHLHARGIAALEAEGEDRAGA